jgi:phage terminase large subunit-like protein
VDKDKLDSIFSLKFEDFYGEKAYVGIDLASKIDLTSFAILFRRNGIYYFFDRTYIPEETVKTTRSVVYDNAKSTKRSR